MKFQVAYWCAAAAALGPTMGFVAPRTKSVRQSSAFGASPSATKTTNGDAFLINYFRAAASDVDDVNTSPSLRALIRSFKQLPSGSDIRGRFVDHQRVGSMRNVALAIRQQSEKSGDDVAPFTPVAAHCFGQAFATKIYNQEILKKKDGEPIVIAIGRDPRLHGVRLCDAFARGAESVDRIQVKYTGVATTPAMFEFVRSDLCDAAVMVTASHLPGDRNGMKFFSKKGGLNKSDITYLSELASDEARRWNDVGILPPTSGQGAVMCSHWENFMPHYVSTLEDALTREVVRGLGGSIEDASNPLAGLRIVLNSGNGSGGFFQQVLENLGADVSNSINLEFDGRFPVGVPNPENDDMVDQTTKMCEASNAHLGVMFDTDADRSGFVVPRSLSGDKFSEYEALNRNRLIAILSTVFSESSPGCTVVTCSVTSEGLSEFLEKDLNLKHVRYLKGYANVIAKAQELTNSGTNAEIAIETSGHCAMKENGYLDDGTYTACKIIGLLAKVNASTKDDGSPMSLLDLISNMKEMPVEAEVRMKVLDGSLDSTSSLFNEAIATIERSVDSVSEWSLDTENLEGIRVRFGDGGFFMLRKSLHDPLISLQVEGVSEEDIRAKVIQPLMDVFDSVAQFKSSVDTSALEKY